MGSREPEEVTGLLEAIRAGHADAEEKLLALVYQQLHRVASGLMQGEQTDHTLQPTALIHEAYIRLSNDGTLRKADNRRFFFATAARAMREILVEHARRRKTAVHGRGLRRVPLDGVLECFKEQNLDVLELHEALSRLASLHTRKAQVVVLRFFGGLTWREVAAELHVSETTVREDFRLARAWLHKELRR